MRYRLTAEVESDALLDSPLALEIPPYTYLFKPDESGRFSTASIEMQVADWQEYLPELRKLPSGGLFLDVPDGPFHKEAVAALQYLEGLGPIVGGIRSVDWQFARWRWLPDADDEPSNKMVTEGKPGFDYPEHDRPLDVGTLGSLLSKREAMDFMTVPLSFYREGFNDFRQNRYISAYMSFYFYIEHLYGDEQFRNREVEKRFLHSEHVTTGLQTWLMRLSEEGADQGQAASLRRQLRGQDASVDSLVRLLVRVRGEVHHSSTKRPEGSPLDYWRYRTMAAMAERVCHHSITRILRDGETPR